MAEHRDLVLDFAESIASATYDRLPPDAIDKAKKSVLDTLGVILAASGLEPASRIVHAIVQETGGRAQCTLLGFGGRGPALMAALANGALAHCLDYDDQTPWGQHAGSSVIPSAFAVAERRGGVSGRDLIAAVAAGQDLFARLRRNVGWKKDWNISTVMGVFAGTAASSRVMGLPPDRIVAALSASSQQSCGIMEIVAGTGSDLRGLYAGFSAKGAVLATLMAESGIAGMNTLFEGPYGFFRTYFDGRYDREAMLAGLGIDYQGGGTLYKRWPAVGTAHSHMKAAIDIVTDEDIVPDQIAEIRTFVGDYHDLMCRPLDRRAAPETPVDAKFSLPFLVAVAVVRRGMSVADVSPDGLRDPRVLATAAKIVPVADPTLNWAMDLPPGRVEIVLEDGRRFAATGTGVPGNADAPMTWDDLGRKFAECAAAAPNPPSPVAVARVREMAETLEDLPDATAMLRVLAGESSA